MLRHPRRLIALTLLILAAFPILLDAAPRATITPAEAPLHEGQRVRVTGILTDLRTDRAGHAHLTLAADGHALPARIQGPLEGIPLGAWIEAHGVLLRSQGTLRLLIDDPQHVHAAQSPRPARPSWDHLATHPDAWTHRLITLTGTIHDGRLHSHTGHHLTLGDGPWPPTGPVHATGTLAYRPHCLCRVLHATQVTPGDPTTWTS